MTELTSNEASKPPKTHERSLNLGVRLPEEMVRVLALLAEIDNEDKPAEEQVSMGDIIRKALKKYIEERSAEPGFDEATKKVTDRRKTVAPPPPEEEIIVSEPNTLKNSHEIERVVLMMGGENGLEDPAGRGCYPDFLKVLDRILEHAHCQAYPLTKYSYYRTFYPQESKSPLDWPLLTDM
ncbi:hypothetical protein EOM60_01080 [Candidatus Saccharibacteria bacterium]|nr:hypothetical protein [Candidatus Saccharibacteria bacterium]